MSRAGIGFCAALAAVAAVCGAQAQSTSRRVTVHYEDSIQNANFPELLYWFVTPQTLAPERYSADVEHIARDTVFDFPFLTAREGVSFIDSSAAHAAVAGLVKDAHEHGLRVGLALPLQNVDTLRRFSLDDDQTLVGDAECMLDAAGSGSVTPRVQMRSQPPLKTELLRVYVFRKSGDGEYDATTLADVTAQAKAAQSGPGAMTVAVDLGPRYAGYTLFAMTNTWFNALDLMSDAYTHFVHEVIDQYRDVPLDGTAQDEFGYERIPVHPDPPFRAHFAGRAFAARFEQVTGRSLTRTIFDMRYAPAGHPEVRIRAIDQYWDFLRTGPLRIEQEFYDYSRQVFGEKNFAGIHDTFHNHLTNDEAWATGINWWTIPRRYGMSDEDLSLPLRMGLLVAHPGPIMYDQYYGRDIHRFAVKAMNDARFDARLHYHGYNDTGRWGVDLSTSAFLTPQMQVERKIRLLNRFDPAAPRLPLLVVFGMPALLNWYPDASARNEFDINGSLHIEEKVQAIWDAGYRCAVVPSDLIDNGELHLNAQNRPVLNGHVFRAVVYLYPQYAKRATLDFLDRYTRGGGALMLEGAATRGFDGEPVGPMFARIAGRARVRQFSVEALPKLGVQPSPLRDEGGELEDGSVILTDLSSVETGQPKAFTVRAGGHEYTGSYVGVFALKAAADGTIEKLACGQCSAVSRDGHEVLRMGQRADLLLLRNDAGGYDATVAGIGGNSVQLRP